MNEKEIFEEILGELKKDWTEFGGKNIKHILEGGLKSYTLNISPIKYGLDNILQTQEEFNNLCLLFEKEILFLSDLKFKKEIYHRAYEKLDKIIQSENSKSLEDVGTDLFCNFYLAYLGTVYENNELFCEIGNIGLGMESGDIGKDYWLRIKINFLDKLSKV